jgi:hypothetical protein
LFGSVLRTVHTPLQRVCPVPHPHTPLLQVVPPVHTTPHAPQSSWAVLGSTQPPPQSTWFAPHAAAHTPPLQTCCAAHALPQAPQFCASEARLAHTPPQFVVWGGQEQAPPEHDAPPVHATPQPPQLWTLVVVSTHPPLHEISVPRQAAAQLPIEHTSPGPHALPHPPQF